MELYPGKATAIPGTTTTHPRGVRASQMVDKAKISINTVLLGLLFHYLESESEMPVLDREESFYPASLLDAPHAPAQGPSRTDDADDEPRWWVLHTRSRQEKAVARDLRLAKVSHCLPLTPQSKLQRSRKKTAFVPIFGNYVFLYGTQDDRLTALKTNRVAHALEVPDQIQLERDLLQLKRLIHLEVPLTIESKLQVGQRVRVKSGSLAGLEGTILERVRPSRLVVAVNYLQQGVSLQIDDFMLEAI
ncbi:MAG: hypothetical protein KDB14_18915 [Planctomycetales bacterium]|nr:hypothetical protein [Planctomycetales bacterium]